MSVIFFLVLLSLQSAGAGNGSVLFLQIKLDAIKRLDQGETIKKSC
jgi:hypothetical protein